MGLDHLEVEGPRRVRLNEVRVADIVPEGSLGRAKIRPHTVSEMEAWQAARHGMRSLPGERVAQLFVDGQLVMSDSMAERSSNFEVCWKAKGEVLVAGLGVGMILRPLLTNPEVVSVTVVEECQDAIDLVSPHYTHEKLSVVQGDIYTWRPAKGAKYDVIYFDIWGDIMTTNLAKMAKLHQAFKSYKRNPGSWMNSWSREHLQDLKRRGR